MSALVLLKPSARYADTRQTMSNSADTVAVQSLGNAAIGSASASPTQASGGVGVRGLKLALAVLLLPACAGLSEGFYFQFLSFSARLRLGFFEWPDSLKLFLAGAGVFAALVILLWRPVVVYVFAHEATHALATWLCLGRVHRPGRVRGFHQARASIIDCR